MEIEEIEDVDPLKTCCVNCRFFEDRTGFCRRNPPVPMQIQVGEQLLTTAMFPKISLPVYDYCGEFENKS